jgi:hypothetical protein
VKKEDLTPPYTPIHIHIQIVSKADRLYYPIAFDDPYGSSDAHRQAPSLARAGLRWYDEGHSV